MSTVVESMRRTSILLVDDQPIVGEAIRRLLEGERDLELHVCTDSARSLDIARELMPAVILQDLVMPGIDGFAQLQRLRSDPRCADIPVIVLSSREEPNDKWRAFELGASDYLVKIPHRLELLARVHAHVRGHRLQRERDAAFRALAAAQVELERHNVELERLARVDGVTGLANRRWMDEVYAVEWRRCLREGVALSVVLCDIDHFKKYNDSYGHLDGDECLRRVARTLATCVRRPADLAARYGGEEFALVLGHTPITGAAVVAENVLASVRGLAIPHVGSPLGQVTISIGVAGMIPNKELPPLTLFTEADQALYRAKEAGRNRIVYAG